jgi:hypothetical protein
MKALFDFPSGEAPYTADACIVWCFDDRFERALQAYRSQFAFSDVIKIAGGAHVIACGGSESERAFVLQHIQTSIQLHDAKRVVLMMHIDCGAQGGSKSFHNAAYEWNVCEGRLRVARRFVAKQFPGKEVDCVFVAFDTVYQIDQEISAMAVD